MGRWKISGVAGWADGKYLVLPDGQMENIWRCRVDRMKKRMGMFDKNQIIQIEITDAGSEGEGIGKLDGFPFFVKDAMIGDRIEAKVLKCKKTYGYARVEKILTPSPYRIAAPCIYARQCGGCQIQNMQYEKQLEFKDNKVRNHLIRLGGVSPALLDAVMEPIIGMETADGQKVPLHYRNKEQYPFGRNKEGETVCGFYAGRTHSIIANTDCLLGNEVNQKILQAVLDYMKECRVQPYDETNGSGLIRHVLIRVNHPGRGEKETDSAVPVEKGQVTETIQTGGSAHTADTEQTADTERTADTAQTGGSAHTMDRKGLQIMVCVIINGRKLPRPDRLVERLAAISGMKSISVSVNETKGNVILGKTYETIWGSNTITDVIYREKQCEDGRWEEITGSGIIFEISPLSFYQVNPYQMQRLYSTALQYADLHGKESVWDLYCGIGTISLFMARHARKVYGVEIVPQAIEDAKRNALRNGITNAEFFVGKAEEVLPGFYEEKKSGQENVDMLHPDVICVDPPRKGCDIACLETMVKMQPERIVYVSCDSATLARDIKYLTEHEYTLERVRACDMFPNTVHVESVCLLTKVQK